MPRNTDRRLKRRLVVEDRVAQNRWMVSYADFITLLFSFFVMMYAVSSVYEGDYRVLADSLTTAFSTESDSMTPAGHRGNPLAEGHFETASETEALPESVEDTVEPVAVEQPEIIDRKEDVVIKRMADSVAQSMSPWIEKNLISVESSPVWLQVDINASALFPSGSAVLSSEAIPILKGLADVLAPFPNAIHVEGFTDNVPIDTAAFPSNWELSAARAASVVRMFAEVGLDPTRMAAVGYGQFRPVADNSTVEGRTRNRRVVLVVLPGSDPRNFLEILSDPQDESPGTLTQEHRDGEDRRLGFDASSQPNTTLLLAGDQ